MRLRSTTIALCVLLSLAAATLPLWAQLPTGRDFRVNDSTAGQQTSAQAAAAPGGRFAVVWVTEVTFPLEGDVFVRLFDPAGRPRTPELPVAAGDVHRQALPAIAMAPNGAFVVTWLETPRDSSASELLARAFTPGGRPRGPAFRVAQSTRRKVTADVAIGSDGTFVVAWQEEQADPRLGAVFFRRFDSAGRPLGPDLPFVSPTRDSFAPQVAVNPRTGEFAIACMEARDAAHFQFDIVLRRFRRDGRPAGRRFAAHPDVPALRSSPDLALAPDGRLGVVWSDAGTDPEADPIGRPGVVSRRFAADGTPLGPELRLNGTTAGLQGLPSIGALAQGAFLAIWDDGADGLFGRLLGPAARSRSRKFRLDQGADDQPFSPALGLAPTGHGVVVWLEPGDDGSADLLARRLAPL